MYPFICVFIGSGLGGAARHLVSCLIAAPVGDGFPYATLLVNVLGSFLVAVIMQLTFNFETISPDLRLFLTTGVMGGFTTYSTFNYEIISRFQGNTWHLGTIYLVTTVVLCIAAGLLGLATGRVLALL